MDGERKYLSDQVRTLQIKCELLVRQNEQQKQQFLLDKKESEKEEKKKEKEREERDRDEMNREKSLTVGGMCALPLSSALRSLLIKCFEEVEECDAMQCDLVLCCIVECSGVQCHIAYRIVLYT